LLKPYELNESFAEEHMREWSSCTAACYTSSESCSTDYST